MKPWQTREGTALRRSAASGGRSLLMAVLAVAAPLGALAQETSLTIYRDGRVLVRRALPVVVARGTSVVSVDLGGRGADPGTLVALDDGVEIRGARVAGAAGLDAALRRAVGHEIEFALGGDSMRFVRATLLSVEPQAVRVDGRVMFLFPGRPVFPESLAQVAPRVELTLEAARALPSLRVAYMSGGMSWRSAYAVTVPRAAGGRGAATGSATIENGALSVRGAQIQLLAGEVPRAPEAGPMMALRQAPAPFATRRAEETAEEGVGEAHLYTLRGTVDLVPGEVRTVALFPRAEVQVEPEYLLRPARAGYVGRWSQPEQDLHAQVSYLIRRPAGTTFGDTPLPAGVVRIFAPDSVGRIQLVGEAPIQHTPAGRELHLATGTAFDVTAQRTQLTYELRGRREVEASYRVQLQSAKDTSVTVQVLDEFPGQWEIVASTVPPERLSASTVRFAVPVPAGGEATLDYRVRLRR